MTHRSFKKKLITTFFAVNIALGGLFGLGMPPAAHAVVDAPSADPDEEIVYIGGDDELIYVLDTQQTGGNPQVKWVSPVGNWREFALGDVNNDGDQEIIAVGGDQGSGRLAVYDPVVASGAINPDQKINGIPWQTLFEQTITFRPVMVAAGNFDVNVAGDEFMVGVEVPEGSRPEADKVYKLDVYKNANPTTPDGKSWQLHIKDRYFEEVWTRVSVGDVISGATEEVGFVDEESGKLEAYRFDAGFARFYRVGDSTKKFQDVAIGQWRSGGGAELAGVRDVDVGLSSFFIWRWDDGELKDDYTEAFNPSPRRVAFADVNGSGDEEAFLLRNVPINRGLAHLLSRNRGNDGAATFEVTLDDDNGFRAVTGGDVDGDGKDEVIIARNDKIRIYDNAHEVTNRFQDYNVPTNRRSVIAGDLDAIGFISGPQFAVDKALLEETTNSGAAKSSFFQLRNGTTTDALPFTITAEGNPAWLIINPISGQTPTGGQAININYTMNAADLLPGVYRSRLKIDSSAEVLNKPLSIVVTFNVVPADVTLKPSSIIVKYTGICTDTVNTTPVTQTIQVAGTSGTTFAAAVVEKPVVDAAVAALGGQATGAHLNDTGNMVLRNDAGDVVEIALETPIPASVSPASVASDWPSGVDWVSASSVTNTIPSSIMVTMTPSMTTETFEEALLIVVADPRAGEPPNNLRVASLMYLCTVTEVYAPIIRK